MKTYTCQVTNLETEQVVERLGYTFQPGETRTVTVRQTSFMELDGCASLAVEVVETKTPPEPARVEDLTEEYQRADELEAELKAARSEQSRLADELSSVRDKVADARAADERNKRDAAANGKKPSEVKRTAPPLEAKLEDASYAHWNAGLRVCELRRDLHRLREPIAHAESRAAGEREEAARAAVKQAQDELQEARNQAEGLIKRPGEHQRKARDAEVQRRDLEAAGPARG